MIRGDFTNISVEELNSFPNAIKDYTSLSNEEWDIYHEYVGSPLYGSESIRRQAISNGFKVLQLYPCYHQGWEMDEWGLIVEKDGKKYILETSHGSLCTPIEYKETSLKRMIMTILGFN